MLTNSAWAYAARQSIRESSGKPASVRKQFGAPKREHFRRPDLDQTAHIRATKEVLRQMGCFTGGLARFDEACTAAGMRETGSKRLSALAELFLQAKPDPLAGVTKAVAKGFNDKYFDTRKREETAPPKPAATKQRATASLPGNHRTSKRGRNGGRGGRGGDSGGGGSGGGGSGGVGSGGGGGGSDANASNKASYAQVASSGSPAHVHAHQGGGLAQPGGTSEEDNPGGSWMQICGRRPCTAGLPERFRNKE